jgi:hypothetical protein
MIPLNLSDFQIVIAVAIFILGCLCILLGAFVLIGRGHTGDVKMLAAHTARLAQKGMTDASPAWSTVPRHWWPPQ